MLAMMTVVTVQTSVLTTMVRVMMAVTRVRCHFDYDDPGDSDGGSDRVDGATLAVMTEVMGATSGVMTALMAIVAVTTVTTQVHR